MTATQIVINVSGGIVQDIFCSDPAAEAIVVDWDIETWSPDEPGIVAVRNELDREQLAHVGRRSVVPLLDLAGTEVEAAIEEANLDTVVRWSATL